MRAKQLLEESPEEDSSELRYTDKQLRIIKAALDNPEFTPTDIHEKLAEEEEHPSKGYIYSVLSRADKDSYNNLLRNNGDRDGDDLVRAVTEVGGRSIDIKSADFLSDDMKEVFDSAERMREGGNEIVVLKGTYSIPCTVEMKMELPSHLREDKEKPLLT